LEAEILGHRKDARSKASSTRDCKRRR